ncbi:MAG: endonuclease/exonuclease/phosphatase family metal-dependent hydrolase [Verrucomicrobiales bacterium]|jgi:endonuclease/exonuclease/phosphatase family metal-dependent hydrolase
MIQQVESTFRRLRYWVSRSEWAVRILRLARDKDGLSAKPGLIMIQIDGLGRDQFMNALEKGRLPFLKSLIENEHYHTHSWYSGLPSSTPAVQGELFYGVRTAVPAFQFLDEKTGELRVMFDQATASKVEDKLADQAEGLLINGSSYSNVYTGGAEESHFCASSMGWANFIRNNSNPLRILLVALLNLPSIFRVLSLLVVETALAILDAFRGILSDYNFMKEVRFVPVRVAVCILLRELIGISVKMDIARGLEVIHANLLGFDEQAHRRGPDSLLAHWSLKGIDAAIRRIAAESKHSRFRQYDIWIYSDHGQEKVIPYAKLTGRTIEESVTQAFATIGIEVTTQARVDRNRTTKGRTKLLFHQDESLQNRATKRTEPQKISVAAMGPVGLIHYGENLGDSQKAALAICLTRDHSVPMALFSNDGGTLLAAAGEDCCVDLARKKEWLLGSDHPFLDEVAADLRDLCEHPSSGQLVVLGYRHGIPPVAFPNENGSHAGAGPRETHGFALLPDDTPLPTHEKTHIRPIDLRHAAQHLLGRRSIVEPFYVKSARSERGKHTLRIMTYNVHRCLGMDGKLSPARIARVIAQYAPDIVALQELDVLCSRSSNEDQAHLIAEHLAMDFHFHPAIHLKEERYGDAILTHYPMELVQAEILPGRENTPHLEPRGGLWVRVDVNGEICNVLNTHLGLRPGERSSQVDALLGSDWLGHPDCNGRVIFCGDFNLLPSSKTFKRLTSSLIDTQEVVSGQQPVSTFSSSVPLARIDHILVDPATHVVASNVPSTTLTCVASDHLPLIADIRTSIPSDQATTTDTQTAPTVEMQSR